MLSLANQHLAVTSISIHPNQQSSQSAANLSIYENSSFKKTTFSKFLPQKIHIWSYTPNFASLKIHFQSWSLEKYVFEIVPSKNTFLKLLPQYCSLENTFSKLLPQKCIFKISSSKIHFQNCSLSQKKFRIASSEKTIC